MPDLKKKDEVEWRWPLLTPWPLTMQRAKSCMIRTADNHLRYR